MMQIIEQTHEETVAMYMKSCTKSELAEMLANCNELLGPCPRCVIADGIHNSIVTTICGGTTV